jgi:hypothetical protein
MQPFTSSASVTPMSAVETNGGDPNNKMRYCGILKAKPTCLPDNVPV